MVHANFITSSNYVTTRRPSSRLAFLWLLGALFVAGVALRAATLREASTLLLAVGGGLLFLRLLTSWSTPASFLGFWVWVHLEDSVRLQTESFAVFFVKNIFFAALLLGFAFDRHRQRAGRPRNVLALPLFVYAGLSIVQCFNPGIPDPLLPLVGLHAKLLYIPLFFIALRYFDSEEKIRQFVRFVTVAITFESALALAQYFQDPSWWYTTMKISGQAEIIGYRSYGDAEALLKTSSIFNNPGRFSHVLLVTSIVVLGAQGVFQGRRLRPAFWVISLVVIFLGGVFVQSSRAVFYLFTLSSAVILLHGRGIKARLTAIVLAALWMAAMSWVNTAVNPKILDFYLSRSSLSPSPAEHDSLGGRAYRGFLQLQSSVRASGLVGHGTGTSSQGRHHFGYFDGKENGYAALIWEFGPLGPLAWMFLMGTLLAHAWRAYKLVRHTRYGKLALAIVLMIASAFVLQYIGSQYLENYLLVMHFWTFAGLLFAMPRTLGISRVPEHMARPPAGSRTP